MVYTLHKCDCETETAAPAARHGPISSLPLFSV